MVEIYNNMYAPLQSEETNIEYNFSNEDLVSHISKRRHVESISELDCFFKSDHASPLCDILNWWNVSLLYTFI
jgi:hypothetical protein